VGLFEQALVSNCWTLPKFEEPQYLQTARSTAKRATAQKMQDKSSSKRFIKSPLREV
jgi:hypothetical protein